MRRPRSYLVLLLLLAARVSTRAQIARAQAVPAPTSNDDVSAIFGALAFDSLSKFEKLPAGTRYFTADSITLRRLSPQASERGVNFERLSGEYTSCPWSSDAPPPDATVKTGFVVRLETHVDSARHVIASARLEC